MKKIGKSMTIAGAAIVAGFGMAIRTAAKFEQSMANVASVAGATSEELEELSDYARKMGEQSVYSASQAADAMYFLASAGMDVNQIMGALEGTLALAAATASDLATTSAAVAAALSQFALDASDATRIANVYAAAISNSQATMDKLTTSMSLVGPMAHSMGMSIEDTTGILMGIYDAGIDASTAGTALRMSFVKLLDPVGKGADALKKLEVAVVDSSGEMRPFKDIIDDLGVAGMTTTDAMDIFGIRAGPAMMALVSQGTGAIQENVEAVTDTNKAFEMAAMQIDTFEGAMKLLRSAFEEFQLTLVDDVLPNLQELVEWITEGVKKVSDWMKENPKLTETIVKWGAGIGALMLFLGPLVMILPSVIAGVTLLSGAFVSFVATGALIAVTVGIIKLTDSLRESIGGLKEFREKLGKMEEVKEVDAVISELTETATQLLATFYDKGWDKLTEQQKKINLGYQIWKTTFDELAERENLAIERREELIYFQETGIKLTYEEIMANREVAATIAEEKKKIEALIESIKSEITETSELLESSEKLSGQMKILTAEYELTNKTIEDTAKYYQNMLKAAEEVVEVKKAERDALEEGTLKWDEAHLAYREAQIVVKDLKEAITGLTGVEKEHVSTMEEVARVTEAVEDTIYKLTHLPYEEKIKEINERYDDNIKVIKGSNLSLLAQETAIRNATIAWELEKEAIYDVIEAEKEVAIKEVTDRILELTDATAYSIQKIDEQADAWIEAGVSIELVTELVKLLKKELEEPPDTGPWEDFFQSLEDEVGSITDIFVEAARIIWEGFSDAISDAVTSFLTMAETNAEILEDMAEAQVDYADTVQGIQEELAETIAGINEDMAEEKKDYLEDMAEEEENYVEKIADLQEDLAKTIQDINDDMLKEKEDYYDDLTDLELDYNRKVSDGVKDLKRENEDYDIDMRRLKEQRDEAAMRGDTKRAKYYQEKMDDCTLAHERSVEDITERQEELTEDHEIEVSQMEEDHKDAMQAMIDKKKEESDDALEKIQDVSDDYKEKMDDMEEKHRLAMEALILKKDEEAQNARDEIKLVKDKYEELMTKMEEDMVTVGGIADTFWQTIKTAGVDALTLIITKLIQYVALWLIGLGPVGWLILAGVGIAGAAWIASKAKGGEIERYQTGGGTDTVPTMLTPGEYVISKPMVDFIKRTGAVTSDLVSAIGSGARTPIPAFAAGGGVSNPISNTYDQRRNYAVNIQPGAIQIVTPRFGEDDAEEVFRLIERKARHKGLTFGRV